jgi:hypothetical protein
LPLADRMTDSYFKTSGQLSASFVRRFKRLGAKSAYVSAGSEALTVSPILDASYFLVMRVWRRSGRSLWKRCPWHSTSVRRLGEELETKLKRAIPGVQFCDLDLEAKAFVPRRESAPP